MFKYFLISAILILIVLSYGNARVENVPANQRVCDFLHHMEVRQILPSYYGTVIPISRKKVAGYLGKSKAGDQ
jgi:hypothetical protein